MPLWLLAIAASSCSRYIHTQLTFHPVGFWIELELFFWDWVLTEEHTASIRKRCMGAYPRFHGVMLADSDEAYTVHVQYYHLVSLCSLSTDV